MAFNDEKPIWDHLDELAIRLRKILISVAIATVAVAILPAEPSVLFRLDFSKYRSLILSVIERIQNALLPQDVELIAFTWLDTFYIYIIVAIALGTLVSLPIIAHQLYQFLSPALYTQERKYVISFVTVFTILFTVGAIYAYFVLLPITFKVLLRLVFQTGVAPLFSVRDFFSIVALGILGSGLFYTFPVIIYLLIKIDLVEIQTLKNNRKQIFVGLLIVTAVLTPDPTPFSMILMVIPFYLLYELTIFVVGRLEREGKINKVVERGITASKTLLARNISSPKREP